MQVRVLPPAFFIGMTMRLIDCGDDVWLGDFQACNSYLPEFDLGIHVWRNANLGENRVCKFARDVIEKRTTGNLVVYFQETHPLSDAHVSIDSIVEYAQQQGRLLAHCAAGASRGPTMCVLAKVARGVEPFKAIDDVTRALYKCGERSIWGHNAFRDIINFAGKRQK